MRMGRLRFVRQDPMKVPSTKCWVGVLKAARPGEGQSIAAWYWARIGRDELNGSIVPGGTATSLSS